MHRKIQIVRILTLFFIFSGTSYAQNIAFIDMDIILKNSKIGISINEQIDKKTETGQKNLKQMEEDIRKKDSQLNAQKNILSEEEFNKKLKLLNTDLQNYQRALQENRNITVSYTHLTLPTNREV